MNEFKSYHPIVNFTYFVFVIGFSCFFMHPVCLLISLFSGFLYSVMLKGTKAIKTNLTYMLLCFVTMPLVNSLFNHEGTSIIAYLPSGNPLTWESVAYGFASACMIVSVIFHFSCYNEIMTSDKFIYLFGRIIPSIALVISMTLRFVPKFSAQVRNVANAQKCMGRDFSKASLIKRAEHGLTILSIMLTWSLENAIETADSMKSRGYGHPGRSTFSIFTFDKRDKKALCAILIPALCTLGGKLCKTADFYYFPTLQSAHFSLFDMSMFVSYFVFCLVPVIIELWEVRKWKLLRSKI